MKLTPDFTDSRIIITQHNNGGWTIELQGSNPSLMPINVGAYTDNTDMLSGLSEIIEDGLE